MNPRNTPGGTRRARPALTRRRFLALSAAGATAGLAAVACGGTKRDASGAKPGATSVPTLTPAASKGGILRTYNFDAWPPDTLDPHLTQFGPIANVHSAVFSRVLRYEDEIAGTIAPDLAAAMPEQPDKTTYIIRLRDAVQFHDTPRHRFIYPKATGRVLTSADLKFNIERQARSSTTAGRRFFRSGNWNVVDSMDASDPHTLIIKLRQPTAPFLSFLAGRHAFILPKEVVDSTDQANNEFAMIGTGPFVLESFEPMVGARLRRNPQWFARDDNAGSTGGGRPYLDGYDAFASPQEDAFQRATLERQLVDSTGFADGAVLDQERKTNLSDIALEQSDATGIFAARLLLDRAPFIDDRVRRALHLAIDRGGLVSLAMPDVDGKPSARLSGPIAPVSRWSPADDLSKRPGYRADAAGREDDLRQARQLWAAAVGDRPLAEVKMLVGGAPKRLGELAALFLQRQLADALGLRLAPSFDASGQVVVASALGRNLDGATEGVAAFTLMLEDSGIDLDDCLYAQFRSGQPGNTYRLQDPQFDAMLDKSRAAFDFDARHQIGLDLQEYLLSKVNARLEFAAPIQRRLTWGYVRNSRLPAWHGANQQLADVWLDSAHPAWRQRPA